MEAAVDSEVEAFEADAGFSAICLTISRDSVIPLEMNRVNDFLKEANLAPLADRNHETMIHSSANGQVFPYFRFDVPQGLEAIASDEWEVPARRSN